MEDAVVERQYQTRSKAADENLVQDTVFSDDSLVTDDSDYGDVIEDDDDLAYGVAASASKPRTVPLKRPKKPTPGTNSTAMTRKLAAKDESFLHTHSDIPSDFVPDVVSGMFKSNDFSYLKLA